ncbi:MAG: hypothetical protein MUF50_03615 [Planctomycetes bacterium]|jgi:PBP1b-binding outer membrane lipoprotein LpoB|nr:hypothetical protein [Planctomycetota bacterium]
MKKIFVLFLFLIFLIVGCSATSESMVNNSNNSRSKQSTTSLPQKFNNINTKLKDLKEQNNIRVKEGNEIINEGLVD